MSVDLRCLLAHDSSQQIKPYDRYKLFAQIASLRPHLIPAIIDLSPTDVFEYFDVSIYSLKSAKAAGLSCRATTSSILTLEEAELNHYLACLKSANAARLVIKFNTPHPANNFYSSLETAIRACLANTLQLQILFEFTEELPEYYIDVAKIVEQTCFYTDLFFRRRIKSAVFSMDDKLLPSDFDRKVYRIAVCGSGAVCLRSLDHKYELYLGSLEQRLLRDLLGA